MLKENFGAISNDGGFSQELAKVMKGDSDWDDHVARENWCFDSEPEGANVVADATQEVAGIRGRIVDVPVPQVNHSRNPRARGGRDRRDG